jgi:truncated hemoglobin YjbI
MGSEEIKQQISDYAVQMGATEVERQTLLGIAYAESRFNPDAKGDYRSDGSYYSHGAFQAERTPGVPLYTQVKDAFDRVRQQSGYLAPIWGALEPYVDNSVAMVMRYHKANWQMGPQASQHWMNYVQQQVDAGNLSGDTKLNIDDFISWAGANGVNADALRGGRDLISEYINQENLEDSSSSDTVFMASTTGAPGGGFVLPFVLLGGLILWWILRKK